MRFRPVIFAWCLLFGATLAMAAAAWIEDDPLFCELEDKGLAVACFARPSSQGTAASAHYCEPGCHRFDLL